MTDLNRKRRIAKERIAEQFPGELKALLDRGPLIVDCGDIGMAFVIRELGQFDIYNIHWCDVNRFVTLQGRID